MPFLPYDATDATMTTNVERPEARATEDNVMDSPGAGEAMEAERGNDDVGMDVGHVGKSNKVSSDTRGQPQCGGGKSVSWASVARGDASGQS